MDTHSLIEAWSGVPPSSVLHHGTACCEVAREWFESMDGDVAWGVPPIWLNEFFTWGAHPWPIYWCEAAVSRVLDCGALAGITAHLLERRKVDVMRVQLIERFNEQNVSCWKSLWSEAGLKCNWAEGASVYHEAVGLVDGEDMRVWDPTDSVWVDPVPSGAYGGVVAVRIEKGSAQRQSVRWGTHRIATGRWHRLSDKGIREEGDFFRALRGIVEMMRSVREVNPWEAAGNSSPGHFVLPIDFEGIPAKIPLTWVGTTGCSWAAKGGCTVCDYGGYVGRVDHEQLVSQAESLLDELRGYPAIQLSALGSFFDEQELPEITRLDILDLVRTKATVRMLAVEARAEHVSFESVRKAVEALGSQVSLEVGLGLESADNTVRNLCINKGLEIDEYERAVESIESAGARHLSHVFLKPPFLTESESIEDAIETVEYSISHNPVRIVLMVANVKRGSLLGRMHEFGEYRPPWLWSVLEVLLRVSDSARERMLVYGFECGMPMLDVGRNCPECTDKVFSLVMRFNAERDVALLHEAGRIECLCKEEWKCDLSRIDERSLEQRVLQFLEGHGLEILR